MIALCIVSQLPHVSGGSVDGNALLIDDDGTGYIAFASVGAPSCPLFHLGHCSLFTVMAANTITQALEATAVETTWSPLIS